MDPCQKQRQELSNQSLMIDKYTERWLNTATTNYSKSTMRFECMYVFSSAQFRPAKTDTTRQPLRQQWHLLSLLMTVGVRTVTCCHCWRFAPAAEQHRVNDGLKRRERVMHSDNLCDKVKVDEEENDSEVDEREWSRDEEDSTHLQQEDERCDQTRFQLTATHTCRNVTTTMAWWHKG